MFCTSVGVLPPSPAVSKLSPRRYIAATIASKVAFWVGVRTRSPGVSIPGTLSTPVVPGTTPPVA